jgi:thiamine kinase-like enzyme
MRLRVEYEGDAPDAPATLFLKTSLPERSGPNWISGRQEVAFYTKVAPKTDGHLLPRCWEAHWDSQTNAWRLLLEDLKDSHSLPTAWPIPPTFAQSKSILSAWAAFHAAWWDDPQLGGTIGDWHEPSVREEHTRSFAGQFAQFADRMGDRLSSERRELFERVFDAGPGLWRRYDSRRNLTIVHGDAHFWNCFLPKDPAGAIRLFDWDAWHIGLCSDDLAYMIAMHFYPDRRRRFERQLLDQYHAALLERGVRGYDRDALDADYRLSVLALIMRPVWQALNDIPPVIWWNNLERIFSVVDDLGCRDLLN